MWRAITEDDVEASMAGPELEALRRAAGDSDGADEDKLPSIIATVTDEVRAHIEDCEENRLGPDGTVPERVIHHAVAIIRVRLLSRVDMDGGDLRTAEYRDAVTFFRRVSECRVRIEQPDPDEVVEESNSPTVDIVTSTDSQMHKDQLKGLF